MRTTLTLEDDLETKLRQYARRKRVSFKDAVNTLLRRALAAPEQGGESTTVVSIETFLSPFREGVDPMKLGQLVDELTAEEFLHAAVGRESRDRS